MTSETAPVGIEEEQGPEQNGNREQAGFDLDQVYDHHDISSVEEFSYQELGRIRKKKVRCYQPGFVVLAHKGNIEETWVEWTPLNLTPGALDIVEQRYRSVKQKVPKEKVGVIFL